MIKLIKIFIEKNKNVWSRLSEVLKTYEIVSFWVASQRFPTSACLHCSPLCKPGHWACQFVCLCLCVFDSHFLSCFYASVVGMVSKQQEAFTPICHRLSSLALLTHTHTIISLKNANTGDLVTAILAFPKLPIATECHLRSTQFRSEPFCCPCICSCNSWKMNGARGSTALSAIIKTLRNTQ